MQRQKGLTSANQLCWKIIKWVISSYEQHLNNMPTWFERIVSIVLQVQRYLNFCLCCSDMLIYNHNSNMKETYTFHIGGPKTDCNNVQQWAYSGWNDDYDDIMLSSYISTTVWSVIERRLKLCMTSVLAAFPCLRSNYTSIQTEDCERKTVPWAKSVGAVYPKFIPVQITDFRLFPRHWNNGVISNG